MHSFGNFVSLRKKKKPFYSLCPSCYFFLNLHIFIMKKDQIKIYNFPLIFLSIFFIANWGLFLKSNAGAGV